MPYYRILNNPDLQDRWVLGRPVGRTTRVEPSWLLAHAELSQDD